MAERRERNGAQETGKEQPGDLRRDGVRRLLGKARVFQESVKLGGRRGGFDQDLRHLRLRADDWRAVFLQASLELLGGADLGAVADERFADGAGKDVVGDFVVTVVDVLEIKSRVKE